MTRLHRHLRLSCLLALAAAGLVLLPGGCVRRRLTVRTNPPGALAFVDDQEIGITPVSTEFTYYGTRKIQLFKDGFETVTAKQRFPTPWYQLPLLDFVAENLWPWEVRDERAVDFQLVPQQIVPNEQLLERAESLRQNTRQGRAVPLWSAPAPAVPPAGGGSPGF